MSQEEYAYLLQLPLVLHLPSLHTFVVHAGILPHDPRHSVTSIHQPLAHVPKKLDIAPPIPDPSHIDYEQAGELRPRAESETKTVETNRQNHSKWNTTAMRNAQELSVLADVPQNADPWVVTNMRGVTKEGEVTK